MNERLVGRVLAMVSSNATRVAPLSSFADYLAASRGARRRAANSAADGEGGGSLRALQAHCEALRASLSNGLRGDESADEVADAAYGARGSSLFVLQSKINHACAPNAKLVCAFTDATIDIVAERDLRRGDEICISYIGPGLGRVRRRQLLRTNYGFGCVCSLCSSEATTTDVATA